MVSPESSDPTPIVGAPTDISPVGTLVPPAHERPAGTHPGAPDWDKIAASPEFRDLLHRKARFIVPASIFFILYYFALPALVGYAKPFMDTHVGPVNVAYLFALSQFFVAWIIAALYVRAANVFDRDANAILDAVDKE